MKMMNSCEKEPAREVYKRAFGAMAGLPGWRIKAEEWLFMPEPLEKLTRDEAFKGVCRRSRR